MNAYLAVASYVKLSDQLFRMLLLVEGSVGAAKDRLIRDGWLVKRIGMATLNDVTAEPAYADVLAQVRNLVVQRQRADVERRRREEQERVRREEERRRAEAA